MRQANTRREVKRRNAVRGAVSSTVFQLAAAGLLLSPVLLDLSLLFPALAPVVRWMPVTLYLRACDGCWTDGLALAAGAAAVLALLWAADWTGQRRTAAKG